MHLERIIAISQCSVLACNLFYLDYSDITSRNDIALIKLAGSVVYTDYIIPACLPATPSDDVTAGTTCWITGWGETQQG